MTAVKTRLGCLHMHHSNIPYIDGIVSPERVELLHFVDPGLMRRIGSDPGFTSDQAEQQVRRQLAWMASCGLDAILITCTNYIAMLPDETLDLSIPVIKIDEPFFAYLIRQESPHLLLFTNPATVEGTMRRLQDYARQVGRQPDIEVEVIPARSSWSWRARPMSMRRPSQTHCAKSRVPSATGPSPSASFRWPTPHCASLRKQAYRSGIRSTPCVPILPASSRRRALRVDCVNKNPGHDRDPTAGSAPR